MRFTFPRTALALMALAPLALSASAGCDSASEPTPSQSLHEAKSALQRNMNPSVPEADLDALVQANTTFAFDLYHQLAAAPATDGKNMVFSPHSVSVALGMLYAGAAGQTKTQMADALAWAQSGLSDEALHAAFNDLDLLLSSRGEGAQGSDGKPFRLRVVNATWAQEGYTFLDSFLDTLAVNYGAGVNLLDFAAQPEPSRETINAWVAEQTEDRIPELLPQGSVTSDTRLVLTNAVYFNAAWASKFDHDMTQDADFHLLDGTTVQVPTMNQAESFRMAQLIDVAGGVTAVELPYDGGEVAMLLLKTDGDFADLEAALAPALLTQVDGALAANQVQVLLPKFEFREKASLVPLLEALGMTDAFEAGAADLSGIDGTKNLVVTDVIHDAFIKTDEDGTEAAAATGVVVGETSAPPPPVPVAFDHPFVYVIRDVETGAVLFVGRVLDPRQEP